MDLRLNGKDCDDKKFIFGLEKIGISGIELSVMPEAKAKILSSYTQNLKNTLLQMFECLPLDQGKRYLEAFDLLVDVLNWMRINYEFEYTQNCSYDNSLQLKLL